MSNANPVVVMETSKGTVTIELWADKAPESAANFLRYVDSEYYDGTIFHRVIDGFMIQGGGFTPDMQQKASGDPIRNEASAELTNDIGTLAMARTNDINSATSQFFINLADNAFLNHRDESAAGFGYAVFAEVTDGMDVVNQIKSVATTSTGMHKDVPAEPVVIISIRRAGS